MKKFYQVFHRFLLTLIFSINAISPFYAYALVSSVESPSTTSDGSVIVDSVSSSISGSDSTPSSSSASDSDPVPDSDSDSAYSPKAPLQILALNPGYTVDGVQNVGEFIELVNVSDNLSLSLTGYSLHYTNTSGKSSKLFEFPEGSQMAGETLLLRLSSAPEADSADLQYSKTLAMEAGPLELLYEGNVVDSVCWRGKDYLAKFSKDTPTSIVRDLSTGEFAHQAGYTPVFEAGRLNYLPPVEATSDSSSSSTPSSTSLAPQCRGLIFNELLSYYDLSQSEQFIEFFNPTDELIPLSGCQLRYKKHLYPLSGSIEPGDYYVRYVSDFTLTKNPSSSNLIELLDVSGEIIDQLEYPHGQKRGTAYALFGYDSSGQPIWQITYAATPGAANFFQEFRSCPAGKVINETTGNCVKAATISSATAACPEGKYRNPLTGRCKKYETSTLADCPAGYERNPETNRCRKVKNNTGANYALVPETGEEKTTFVAALAVGAVLLLALGYVLFQYRSSIFKLFARSRSLQPLAKGSLVSSKSPLQKLKPHLPKRKK